MDKIPVYFMPGLAASPAIFENIQLPPERFECHYLEWLIPQDGEAVSAYAKRLAAGITHENPVLIGVSFGGIIVQELAQVVQARKTIIISSVRCNAEFPRRMRFAKASRIYALFPTGMMTDFTWMRRIFRHNRFVARRLELYDKFMSVRDKKYLDWAFKTILNWDRCEPDPAIIHIHGDMDEVFPPKYLQDYIPVEGGTHIMVLSKYKWLNENLPGLIEGII
jgi:pimeloyl-ACP methyl ester carboxylesterase